MVARRMIQAGLALALSAFLATGPARSQPARPLFAGVWMVTKPQQTLRTLQGERPPLLPEALKAYQKALAAKAADQPLTSLVQCQPVGPVRMLFAPYPMMILQTPRKITLVHEYQHLLQHVYLDEPLPVGDALDPTFMGSWVGHWQGSDLVTESAGFNERTTLDRSGLPHSDALKVVERFRLFDKGRRMRVLITIDDPKTFIHPWSTSVTFVRRPKLELKEYLCSDDNRNG